MVTEWHILLLMAFFKALIHLSGGGVGKGSAPALECQPCQEWDFPRPDPQWPSPEQCDMS